MSVSITYEFKCDECEHSEARTQSGLLPDFAVLDRRCIPIYWQWVGYKLLCPAHEVKIVTTGGSAE